MQRTFVEMLVIWWRRGELRWELLPPSDREAMQVWMIEEAIEHARHARQPLEIVVELHRPRPPAPPRARLLGDWGNRHRRRGATTRRPKVSRKDPEVSGKDSPE